MIFSVYRISYKFFFIFRSSSISWFIFEIFLFFSSKSFACCSSLSRVELLNEEYSSINSSYFNLFERSWWWYLFYSSISDFDSMVVFPYKDSMIFFYFSSNIWAWFFNFSSSFPFWSLSQHLARSLFSVSKLLFWSFMAVFSSLY